MMTLLKSEMLDLLTDYLALFEVDLSTNKVSFASRPLERMLGYSVQGDLEGKLTMEFAPGLFSEGFLSDPQPHRAEASFISRDGSTVASQVLLLPRSTSVSRVVVGVVVVPAAG